MMNRWERQDLLAYADRLAQQEQLRRLYPRHEAFPLQAYRDEKYSTRGPRWSQWL